ncbi:hypothetical protein Tco_0198582, partial [Tanacetum coccineum]
RDRSNAFCEAIRALDATGSLEDIPRLDTTKSNILMIKNVSFKKRSSIKLYVPKVHRTYLLCTTLSFESKTVNIALTQQVRCTISALCAPHFPSDIKHL